MTIKTRASLQSFFQKGDRPTSAQFADLINSYIQIPVAGSTVSTGLLEVVGTASTTSHTLGTFANSFLGVNTTAQAQAFMAFTSASGAGGGAFGTDWLNAAVTSDGADLLGTYIASNVLLSAGDTLYTDGSGLQRLTAGTSSYVYTYNSANAAPQWSAPRPTLVSAGADDMNTVTSKNFPVPTTTKKFTVTFNGISTNGTSPILIRLGDSGGVETTGYLGTMSNTADIVTSTVGVPFGHGSAIVAATVYYGAVSFTLSDTGTNEWLAEGTGFSTANAASIGGYKALSDKITTVQITTQNGTDAFDGGRCNVVYS